MSREKVFINFGCSESGYPGWINVDKSFRHIILSRVPFAPLFLFKIGILSKQFYLAHKEGKFKNVRYGDVAKKLNFKSGSVDCIYSSHMLEHLYFDDANKFLKESFRILKKGGILRIVVPDAEEIAREYVEGLDSREKNCDANKFSMEIYTSRNKKESRNGHRWMYDRYSLAKSLENAGFQDISLEKLHFGKCPDLKNVEAEISSGIAAEAFKL